ncbi:MAG TPA: hypothetical protein VI356_14665 [Myxococcales bacterium]
MRPHRGSVLIAALVVIAVLALVTVATLRLADISKGQSAKDARKLGQAACIDAARQYLISRLNVFNMASSVTFDQVISTEAGDRHIYSGHVRGQDAMGKFTGPVITSQPRPVYTGVSGGASSDNLDITNTLRASSGRVGTAYQVIVACSDPLAGDMELEFSLQFGL